MTDLVIDYPLSTDLLKTVAQPEATHGWFCKLLPDMHGRSAGIRIDTGSQFRVDLPSDPLGEPGDVRLRVRSAGATVPGGRPIETPPLVSGTRCVALVAAEKRNTVDGAVRVRPVTDEEMAAWATGLLARHGIDVEDLAWSAARGYGVRGERRVRFTVRDLSFVVADVAADAAKKVLANGIGRGRAYGLGMVVPVAAASVLAGAHA
ncbi:hypothetical protein FB554_2927 [Barrientosiimonas humi]|uniref:CRISPR system Cascade subunit CasE n=1 Tax=Barrientosiimonas humi TaxID=999931 RepID=A0A542XFZ8_9MICO|nr:type I-E CRISPR-associated protein Cas6/Cse3/CasE [Barrientosiimonas humi]TQL34748.1 hypothetical protein FB554_2927 [Barrientosiimonas humi]CAG7570809.1 hypothetical protein BH39T_PBIAJDOK_00046 [Barrientosiimonas humi]